MLCERCGQNDANIHIKQTINGAEREIFLCADCASKECVGISFKELFDNFLASFLEMDVKPNIVSDISAQVPAEIKKKVLICAVCGLTYADIKQSGKIGCASCYKTFYKQLSASVKRIQGDDTHRGKAPVRRERKAEKAQEISLLKNRLKEAIDAEEYEEAARLRDMIKAL